MVKGPPTCTGGPLVRPCQSAPFVKVWIVGGSEVDQYVCGRHFWSVTTDLLKRGSYLGVRKVTSNG